MNGLILLFDGTQTRWVWFQLLFGICSFLFYCNCFGFVWWWSLRQKDGSALIYTYCGLVLLVLSYVTFLSPFLLFYVIIIHLLINWGLWEALLDECELCLLLRKLLFYDFERPHFSCRCLYFGIVGHDATLHSWLLLVVALDTRKKLQSFPVHICCTYLLAVLLAGEFSIPMKKFYHNCFVYTFWVMGMFCKGWKEQNIDLLSYIFISNLAFAL